MRNMNEKRVPSPEAETAVDTTMEVSSNETDNVDGAMKEELPLKANCSRGSDKQQTISTIGEMEEEAVLDEACGWGKLQPSFFQRLRNPKMVLFWLCCGGTVQGILVNGLVPSVVTSLEKRFEMDSFQSGLFLSAYEIASVLCLIPVSYFGGIGRKPRWIGIGMLILGIGALIFSLPHFLTGLYVLPSMHVNKCYRDMMVNSSSDCNGTKLESTLSKYNYVFIFAQLLHGMGSAPLYTVGVTYLDDNLQPKMTGIYVGIFVAMSVVGPALGYVLGGGFLNFYVDLTVPNNNMTPYHPLWVGAWWIGFIFSGLASTVIGIIFLGFPKLLPGHQKAKDVCNKGKELMGAMSFGSLLEIPNMLKSLLTNPEFMLINIAGSIEGLIAGGFSAFAPKFIEAQFSLTSNWAAQFIGYAGIPAGGCGTFLGGLIVTKMNLQVKGLFRLCIVTTVLSLLSCLCFLVRCDIVPFAGVSEGYNNKLDFNPGNLESPCNEGCQCTTDKYSPVCGTNGLMYFSPCHAGCDVYEQFGSEKHFKNCSCIDVHNSSIVSAVGGKCESKCDLLPVYLPFFGCLIMFTCITGMGALTATLRCVADAEKSFALGIQWIIIRCLGTIPAPIVYGKLLDATCLLWQDACGTQGSCYVYSNDMMGRNLMVLSLSGKVLSLILFSFAYYHAKLKPKAECCISDKIVTSEGDDGSTIAPPN